MDTRKKDISSISNKEKRKPKSEVKLKLNLSDEQRLAKQGFYEKPISLIMGEAASGKTAWAANVALSLFFKREIERIIISRPIVKNSLGYLPGDINEKMDPWIMPIKQCLYDNYEPCVIDRMFEEKTIQILPLDYTKGITYSSAVIIQDEIQDATEEDLRLILTRLGKDSKLILIGSEQQVDKSVKNSCISLLKKMKSFDGINAHTFVSNHRHEIIFELLNYLNL